MHMNKLTGLLLAVIALAGCVLAPASSQETGPAGANLFARYCASCHGPLGEGDGPVAASILITVPNLRTLSARADGTFPRDSVIRYIDGRDLPAAHGERLMPVWGEALADIESGADANDDVARQRIESIVDFLEQLQN